MTKKNNIQVCSSRPLKAAPPLGSKRTSEFFNLARIFNFLLAFSFFVSVPLNYPSRAMLSPSLTGSESITKPKSGDDEALANRLKDTIANPLRIETHLNDEVEEQREKESSQVGKSHDQLGTGLKPGSNISSFFSQSFGKSAQPNERKRLIPKASADPSKNKKAASAGKASKRSDEGPSFEEIEIDDSGSETSTNTDGDYIAGEEDLSGNLRNKFIVQLGKVIKGVPNKRLTKSLNAANIETSLTLDKKSVILTSGEQRKYLKTFKALSEKEPSGSENWTAYDQQTAIKLRSLFSSEHEIIIKVRTAASDKTVNPAFTFLALNKSLTREPIVKLPAITGISTELSTLATEILSEASDEPTGLATPLKDFLRSKRDIIDYNYNDLATNVTIYTEAFRDWKDNPTNFMRLGSKHLENLNTFFNVSGADLNTETTNSTFTRAQAEIFFSKENSKKIKNLSVKLGEMVAPLTEGFIDYSIALEKENGPKYKKCYNYEIQRQTTSGWENATEEELAELIHNNMRKKVASIASDPESTFGPNSSLVYEKPDTDVNRFSLKNRGTNLIKWKASRADQELIRLFAQSVNESYKNQGSNTLRGVGGFQSEKKSEERFLGLMGITYFATLNKIN